MILTYVRDGASVAHQQFLSSSGAWGFLQQVPRAICWRTSVHNRTGIESDLKLKVLPCLIGRCKDGILVSGHHKVNRGKNPTKTNAAECLSESRWGVQFTR